MLSTKKLSYLNYWWILIIFLPNTQKPMRKRIIVVITRWRCSSLFFFSNGALFFTSQALKHECLLVQTVVFVLGASQPGVLSCQCSDSGKTETSPSGSPQKVGTSGVQSTPLLSSPRRSWALWLPFDDVLQCWGRHYGKRVPQMFLSAPVQLGLRSYWGTGASQLIFRFLTNEIGLCIVELVYTGEEGSGSFRLLFLLIKSLLWPSVLCYAESSLIHPAPPSILPSCF